MNLFNTNGATVNAMLRSMTQFQLKLAVAEELLAKEKEKGIDADKEKILILEAQIKSFQEFGNAQKLVGFLSKKN